MPTNTRTKIKPSKSRKAPEQRAAEAQALHETLVGQIEHLVESEAWLRFLAFTRSFHAYSLPNLLLILAQCPHATQVAGFRQLQAKGRQVRKGERAIKIRGFSTKKVTEEDPETGDEVERQLRRFPILSVFDVSQTGPIEGADTYDSEHVAQRLTGDDPAGIYTAMAEHLTGQGWTVDREPIPGEVNGYTTTKRIVVDVDLEPAQAAKTILHEAAHALLHTDEAGEYVTHRGLFECEAESVAYVLAGLVGLDTSTYSVGYIAAWTNGETETVKNTATRVLGTVHQLAPALVDDETTDDETTDDTTDRDGEPATVGSTAA